MRGVFSVLTGLSLLCITSSALAAPSIELLVLGSFKDRPIEPRVQIGMTPYTELQTRFDSAKGLSIREISGWYAGRCYYADSPTRPVAALLAVESSVDKAHGPAITSSEYRRITPLVSLTASADYFDKLTSEKSDAIRTSLARHKDDNAYPVRSNDTLVVDGMRTMSLESRQYLLRRNEKFLFLRAVCTETNICLNYRNGTPTNRVVTNEGESPLVCYYFKRVAK